MPNRGGRGNRNPTHLKVLAGNPGKEPIRPPVQLPQGVPEPPPWLEGRALELYRRLSEPLARVGLLTEADGPLFAELCLCLARKEQAEAQLSAEGLVVRSPQGVKVHPAVKVAKEYRTAALALAKEFGLTPHARGSLDVAPREVQDELARLLEGGR